MPFALLRDKKKNVVLFAFLCKSNLKNVDGDLKAAVYFWVLDIAGGRHSLRAKTCNRLSSPISARDD